MDNFLFVYLSNFKLLISLTEELRVVYKYLDCLGGGTHHLSNHRSATGWQIQLVLFFSYTAIDQKLSKINTTVKYEILKRKQTSNWQSDQKADLLQMSQCLGVTMQARSCAILAKIMTNICLLSSLMAG